MHSRHTHQSSHKPQHTSTRTRTNNSPTLTNHSHSHSRRRRRRRTNRNRISSSHTSTTLSSHTKLPIPMLTNNLHPNPLPLPRLRLRAHQVGQNVLSCKTAHENPKASTWKSEKVLTPATVFFFLLFYSPSHPFAFYTDGLVSGSELYRHGTHGWKTTNCESVIVVVVVLCVKMYDSLTKYSKTV